MTEYRKKAVENLVVRSEDDGLWYCQVCGEMRKTESGIKNHILKAHGDVVENDTRALEKKHLASSVEYYSREVQEWYQRISAGYGEAKKEFMEKAGENLLHTLEWYTEKAVKETVKWQEATRLYRMALEEGVIGKEIGEVDWEMVRLLLDRIIEYERDKLLQRPPTHHSTSAMDFMLEVWGYEARCDFWGENTGSAEVAQLKYWIKRIIEDREKLESL